MPVCRFPSEIGGNFLYILCRKRRKLHSLSDTARILEWPQGGAAGTFGCGPPWPFSYALYVHTYVCMYVCATCSTHGSHTRRYTKYVYICTCMYALHFVSMDLHTCIHTLHMYVYMWTTCTCDVCISDTKLKCGIGGPFSAGALGNCLVCLYVNPALHMYTHRHVACAYVVSCRTYMYTIYVCMQAL